MRETINVCRDVSFEPIGDIVDRLVGELVAADTGRTVPTASAQTGRGRAAHNAGEGGGVVIELKRGSRSAQGEWAWRLPLDDGRETGGCLNTRKLATGQHVNARSRAKLRL